MVFAEPRGEPSRSELRAGGQKNQESRNFQGSAGEAKISSFGGEVVGLGK